MGGCSSKGGSSKRPESAPKDKKPHIPNGNVPRTAANEDGGARRDHQQQQQQAQQQSRPGAEGTNRSHCIAFEIAKKNLMVRGIFSPQKNRYVTSRKDIETATLTVGKLLCYSQYTTNFHYD